MGMDMDTDMDMDMGMGMEMEMDQLLPRAFFLPMQETHIGWVGKTRILKHAQVLCQF